MIPLRDDAPRFSVPAVTWFLVLLNIIVFLFEISLAPPQRAALISTFGFVPAAFMHGNAPWLTLITAMFLHASWGHVIGNMWFLVIFGDNVEDYLGHFRFLLFYFVCGIAAAGLQIVFDPTSTLPGVGASGAIAGVLGAYFALYPSARVLMFFPIFFMFWLPAWIVLGYWFVVQFLSGAATSIARTASTINGGGIAFWAHVGGFAAGLVLAKLLPTRHTRFRLQH